MNVGQIMSKRLVTVEVDDRLGEVKSIFDAVRFHHLLVVEAGKLRGVISDRDLLRALSPFIGTLAETSRDLGTLDKRVHQIMSRKLLVLQADAGIADAIELFLKHSISCIPIVDADSRPVGIVSWRDVLKVVAAP